MKNMFDEKLAERALIILSRRIPDEIMLREFSELIQSNIAQKGRGTDNHPTMAAVLEERIQLDGLSTKQKLAQSRDIIEFMKYFKALLDDIPSPMPEIVKKAGSLTPGFDKLLAPHRRNLN